MTTLDIAVVGGGFIGLQHIEAIRRIPGLRVKALVEPNRELGRKVAASMDIPEYYSSTEELLKYSKVDAVHNCTPSNMHYPVCKELIAGGIHVFCEKPLTLTVPEAEELTELAAASKVGAGVDFVYRQNAMVREMRERIKGNRVGKILTIDAEYLQDWMMYKTDYDWRLDPAVGGRSRAAADIGSHCFDAVQFLCGERITEVFAHFLTVYPVRRKTEKDSTFSGGSTGADQAAPGCSEPVRVENEDAAYILFKTESGIEGMVHVSQVRAGKKNAFSIAVGGDRGSLNWDQEYPDKLWIGDREKGNTLIYASSGFLSDEAGAYAPLPAGHPIGWADALKKGIELFYQSIREGTFTNAEQKYPTFREAAYVMKIVDACLRSDALGRWVKVLENS